MSTREKKNPIYEKQVNTILEGLSTGESREEIAQRLDYSNPRSIDTYMRRKNFVWDSDAKTYIPANSRGTSSTPPSHSFSNSKATAIIHAFDMDDSDAKSIAIKQGFATHRELAEYMKSKGYAWNQEQGNYVKSTKHRSVENEHSKETNVVSLREKNTFSPDIDDESSLICRYLPLLDYLENNKEQLSELLSTVSESGQIPRYVLSGIPVTKSVHMVNTLDQMVRDFSQEKNISQKDLFQVALIEFLKRYGYAREVETMLREG